MRNRAARVAAPWTALAMAAVVAACVAPVAEAPVASRPAADAVLARLPAKSGGFLRGAAQDVAAGDPGAGRVVEYATPRRVAVGQVFLYDLGRPDVTAAELPAETERAVSEATALPVDRTGRQLSVSSRFPLALEGGDLSCALLSGTFGRNQVERQVCVGVVAGRFMRVQVTMPTMGAAVADARAFAQDVVGAARRG